MWRKIIAALAAAAGAVASFFCGLPPLVWVLLAVMTIDYVTGIICAVMGKSPKTEHGGLSSGEAFKGLLHKALILLVVMLAALLDHAVSISAEIEFAAVAGTMCPVVHCFGGHEHPGECVPQGRQNPENPAPGPGAVQG